MKFGKQLAAQQIPAWSVFYVDYKGLKKIINSLAKGRPADAALLAAGLRPPFNLSSNVEGSPASELSAAANLPGQSQHSLLPESGESALLQAHKAAFFFKLERELEKINAFYLQKEAEMKSRMRALIDKRKVVQAHLAGKLSRDSACFIALHEGLRYFERDLSKLQNYIEMNATGFRKILKKWDKRSKSTTKELYLARQVDVQPCFNREVISELSDTAAANVRKLENLCTAKGGEQTVDPAADGILSERKQELAEANAEAQDDLLSNLETELITAIRAQDREAVEAILSNMPSFDSLEYEICSQLARIFWRAAILDSDSESRLLPVERLDFGFIDDINGRTPLIEAAARGKLGLVRLCVEHSVSIRHKDVYGREALHYAAMSSPEVSTYLLDNGADQNPLDLDGASPLLQAISAGQLECVQTLLRYQGTDSRTGESVQPLALAAKQGHTAIVSLLLASGHTISPDASGFLPHHISAKEGHEAVLAILLQAGANVNAPDKFANWTPLLHAANEGHLSCVRTLLAAGASIEAVDDQSKSAIHHAAWSGHPEIVSALLQARKPVVPASRLPSSSSSSAAKKRTAADVAAADMDMDLDSDLIPDLSLPPPALPLRTYGHSYLDARRSLVQIALGHNTTSAVATPPVRFYRQEQPASLKLVITSQQDSFNAPHTVMLPLTDERESISLLVDELENLTLQLELFPAFGSRLIGKAVCLPSTFSQVRNIQRFTAPVLDTHLALVGEVNFEISFVTQFQNVQLAIGGRLETYWKSTTTEAPTKPVSWKSNLQDQTFITASSLAGDYSKVVVQVTIDGVPFISPKWLLPTEDFKLHLMDRTAQEVSQVAARHGQSLSAIKLPALTRAADWHSALSNVNAPLSDVLAILPDEVGLNIEVRYPTPSDCARLGIREVPEINASIDAILSVVYANTLGKNGGTRRILFSSFSPAACAVLNWKQPNYAVLFASYCGLSRSTPEGQLQRPNRTELDKRCTSIEGAVKFAKANNLLGVLLDATIVTQVPSLVHSIKENGLLLGLFGTSATKDLGLIDAHETAPGVLSTKAAEG